MGLLDDEDFARVKPKMLAMRKYAGGGLVQPAAMIDGDEFVMAARRYGLDDMDQKTLNRSVNLVNQGETVEAAARKVAGKM